MKTLYLECNMGAAGDMLNAALLELHPQPEEFVKRMNQLGLSNVTYRAEPAAKCGICGTHVSVRVGETEEESVDIEEGHVHAHHQYEKACEREHGHSHKAEHEHEHHCNEGDEHVHGYHEEEHSHHGHPQHHHAGMHDICHIIEHLEIPEEVKADAVAVYRLIAEAESLVHGRSIDEIHFHEVGTLDAITDVIGVCLLIHELAPERIVVSPVHVGSGQVRCAHGILPVPTPAAAHILKGVPVYGGQIKAELCTPTGAALLKHFAASFGPLPLMTIRQIGYGMGKKEFEIVNCVRAIIGEAE